MPGPAPGFSFQAAAGSGIFSFSVLFAAFSCSTASFILFIISSLPTPFLARYTAM